MKEANIMTTLGFKKVKMAVLDANDKAVSAKTYVFDSNFGGTQTATIGGLEQITQSIDASDGNYHTSMSGIGNVTLEMAMVEMTAQQKSDIFGIEYEDGILKYGKNNRAPYVALEFYTEDLQGNEVRMGLLKGKLTLGDVQLETGTSENGKEAQTLSISGTFETRSDNDLAFVVANANDEDFVSATWEALVFPTAP